MFTIRIDDELVAGASSQRRHDLEILVAELATAEALWETRRGSTIIFGRDEHGLRLRFVSAQGVDVVHVARDQIASELSEYLAVISLLEEDDVPMARLEALDMAKRVVHDRAAKKLLEILPDVSPSLETRRRVFSLLVALLTDTSGRRMGHGYR